MFTLHYNCTARRYTTLHYTTTRTTTTLHHTTSSSCGWGDHRNPSKKHNSNQLSVHQWIHSAIHASQQLPSPVISFLSLKLPPPPCAVLLWYTCIETQCFFDSTPLPVRLSPKPTIMKGWKDRGWHLVTTATASWKAANCLVASPDWPRKLDIVRITHLKFNQFEPCRFLRKQGTPKPCGFKTSFPFQNCDLWGKPHISDKPLLVSLVKNPNLSRWSHHPQSAVPQHHCAALQNK